MFFPFVVAGFGTSACAHSGKAGAFAALLLNISPLFTLSLGSAAGFRSRRRAQIATVARQPARRRFPAMLGPL